MPEGLLWDAPLAGLELISRLPDRDEGRPPLLFVHAMCLGAWSWDEHWLPAAADAGWPAHALSLRGHGDSSGHDDLRTTTITDYVDDVMQAITALPAPPVLIGHSMGGLVVQRVLERYPAAPAAVLVASVPPTDGFSQIAALARRPADLARAIAGRPLPMRREYLFCDDLDPATAQRHVDRTGPESPLVQYALTLPRRAPRVSDTPVLVLGAGDDALVPVADVRRTARHYRTQARMFYGMGHAMMLDVRWQWPLTVVLEWLDDLVGTRAERR
jgi:pimeloyl-ACP methyl ester carboxylesterase